MNELFSTGFLPLYTVITALAGAAVAVGVHRQQLRGLITDMGGVQNKIDAIEVKINAVEADVLRNYVATTTLDKSLEPLTAQFHMLHSEIRELRTIIMRKFG